MGSRHTEIEVHERYGPSPRDEASSFARKAWIAAGIVSLLLIVAGLLRAAAQVLLIIFAGILLGVFIDGLTRFVERHTHLPRRIAWGLVLLLLAGIVVAFGWYFAPQLAHQLDGLSERLSSTLERMTRWVKQYGWGDYALQYDRPSEVLFAALEWAGGLTRVLSGVLGALGSALIITVAGIYFSFNPAYYVDNGIRLVPIARRPRIKQVVSTTGTALRSWLIGRFLSMALVWAGTSLGLWIVDVPMALALGFIAGVLSFVPNIGPILAAIPGLLIALSVSPATVLFALLVYVGVQTVESYFITPFVEQYVVALPPGVLLSVQLLFSLLAGLLGLFMATPLAVVAVVAIQLLYVEDVLGDEVAPLGQDEPVTHAPSVEAHA